MDLEKCFHSTIAIKMIKFDTLPWLSYMYNYIIKFFVNHNLFLSSMYIWTVNNLEVRISAPRLLSFDYPDP